MDWHTVYFGKVGRHEVQKYVIKSDWQNVRLSMKGTSLKHKFETLTKWLKDNNFSREAQVQVTNYVTALSRGGLITPADYT